MQKIILTLCLALSLAMNLSAQTENVVVPVIDITTNWWNLTACPEDPDLDLNNRYAGAFSDKDVNKLRTRPYSPSSNPFDNPNINNHTFWFSFGCCGETYCADDYAASNVYTDDFWNVGSLYMPNVWVGDPTSIWVNFLTQCEDCSGSGIAGTGVWHKAEDWYGAGDLIGHNRYPFGPFGTSPSYVASVSCNPIAVYGCQSNEEN